MDVTPLISSDMQVIQRYGDGRFRISGQEFEGGVFIMPLAVESWTQPEDFQDLTIESFAQAMSQVEEIDVLLLGCGARTEFLPPDIRQVLKDKGLVVEAMDTGAACRTFNVLIAEGRRVAAFLMPV